MVIYCNAVLILDDQDSWKLAASSSLYHELWLFLSPYKESLAITSWKLCEQMNMALLTGPPAVLKLFVLGALLVLKLSLYWGAGVKGAWQAGVATIIKKGGDASDCSFMKLTACSFWEEETSILKDEIPLWIFSVMISIHFQRCCQGEFV